MTEYDSQSAAHWLPASTLGQSAAHILDKLTLSLRLARMTASDDPDALSIIESCEKVLEDIRADLVHLEEKKP